MEPLRVAHILGKMSSGGVESVVMNYYRHINRSKIQFDFIVDEDSSVPQKEEIKSLGGRIIIIPPYQKIFSYLKELKRVLKENDYKIVHSHINALSVFPLFAAKQVGINVRIAHNHTTSNKKEWKKALMKGVLKPFSKLFSTHYFACSEKAGRWLFGNKFYNKNKVQLINNAIDTTQFIYNLNIRNIVRKELKLEDKFIVGHVGRFTKAKNQEFLIDIFAELLKKNDKSHLLFVGEGELENILKQKVEELGLNKYVTFLGVRKDINNLMQGFDMFLLPSLYEGLPVVGIEAQSSGLFCALSANMTKETKVLDKTMFISLNESAEEWAKKIIVHSQNDQRSDVSKIMKKRHFEIKNEAKLLEKKYMELIANDQSNFWSKESEVNKI